MENLIKSIVEKTNRSFNYDNRNRATRGINEVLTKGVVKISIQQKGKIWTNPKFKKNGQLFKFNIQISGFGRTNVWKINSFDPLTIAQVLSKFLMSKNVQKEISITYKHYGKCERCLGQGIIPQFNYYCNGICFDCYGSGISPRGTEVKI